MYNWQQALNPIERLGEIEQYIGLKLVANGPPQAFIGELCTILDTQNKPIMQAEVIGFDKGKVFLMPFTKGRICPGYKVRAGGNGMSIGVGSSLQGRVIDALGMPLDKGSPLFHTAQMPLHPEKINPFDRKPIDQKLETGIRAIDGLLPLGQGQRIGLFAGSGVGKSVLLGMMAKRIHSDINVIALIGERGREVNDFIQNNLDEATRAKSVLVVACSDESALMRKQAVYTATAIAEYFCSQGKQVMLFMDSITRFAMAMREISLSLGEPPTARGYTPGVFAALPGIVERAGTFKNKGSITALYTVLVEGDDFNEPVTDTMRSLLDGHIVLTRELAHRGHYPAIDVLQSISRLSHQISSQEERDLMREIVRMLGIYQQNKDLIALGAYQPGNNPSLDKAVKHMEKINQILTQAIDEPVSQQAVLQQFGEIIA